jgi:hypothetical protein
VGIIVEEDSEGNGLVFARYHADINSTKLGMRLIQENPQKEILVLLPAGPHVDFNHRPAFYEFEQPVKHVVAA